jgi:large subunit ribosomal protein L22
MQAMAKAKYLRTAPLKARIVANAVKGKRVKEALAILKFTPNAAARFIEKVVQSAAANAENNHRMDADRLKVTAIFVDTGPSMKRVRYAPMGRGYRMVKRMSHITVVVEEGELPIQKKGTVLAPGGARPRAKVARPNAVTPVAKATVEASATAKPKRVRSARPAKLTESPLAAPATDAAVVVEDGISENQSKGGE